MISMGIKYVRKENMWIFYVGRNIKGQPDVNEYFSTKAEAEARLKKEDERV